MGYKLSEGRGVPDQRWTRIKRIRERSELGDALAKPAEFSYAEIIDIEAAKTHDLGYKRLKEVALNRRRSELDIVASILNISMNGAKKTNIFRGANLSYTLFKKYLSYMVGTALLKEKKGLFYTTEKGVRFLGLWGQITSLL